MSRRNLAPICSENMDCYAKACEADGCLNCARRTSLRPTRDRGMNVVLKRPTLDVSRGRFE